MKKLHILLLPVFLCNPCQRYIRNSLNKYNIVDFYLQTIGNNLDRDYDVNRDILGRSIVINVNNNHEELERDDVEFIDLKDQLFPKVGTAYSEKTESRGVNTSKKVSTLTFRKEQKTHRGGGSSSKGSSSTTHPENVANFEKAGIHIDPMKNPNKRPDGIQRWKWNRKKQEWMIVGERTVKVGNKIITESEWQRMLTNHSSQV